MDIELNYFILTSIFLSDEQLEGGETREGIKSAEKLEGSHSNSEEAKVQGEPEAATLGDVRVPVNGQVVHVPLSMHCPVSATSNSLCVGAATTPSVSVTFSGTYKKNSVMPSGVSLSGPSHTNLTGPPHTSLTTPLSVALTSPTSFSVKSAKNGLGGLGDQQYEAPGPPLSSSAIALLTTVTSSANFNRVPAVDNSKKEREKVEEDGNRGKGPIEFPYTCPVCEEPFKSKRSFNAHIIVHCQVSILPLLTDFVVYYLHISFDNGIIGITVISIHDLS